MPFGNDAGISDEQYMLKLTLENLAFFARMITCAFVILSMPSRARIFLLAVACISSIRRQGWVILKQMASTEETF